MDQLLSCFCAMSLLGVAAPVGAKPPLVPLVPLEPSGKWVVEFEDNRCTAGLAYASPKGEVALGFEPLPTQGSTSVILQIPSDLKGMDQWPARIRIGTTSILARTLVAIPSTRAGMARYSFTLSDEEFAELVKAQDLTVDGGPIHLALRNKSLPGVAATLRNCVSDLLNDWGLTLREQANLATFPKMWSQRAFSSTDYPSNAVHRSAVGEIVVRVMVDVKGVASGCTFVRPSGHADLDAATCKGALETHFAPARDKAGRPMRSPAIMVIRWLTNR